MKLLGLVVVLAIILSAYNRRLTPGKESVDTAMKEFEQTVPAPSRPAAAAKTAAAPAQAAPTAAPTTSNLRRPIDRTRAVLEQVKARNGDGEF